MRPRPLVPDDFEVPEGLEHERFRLRMLTVNDVVKDFEAINARVAPDGRDDPWNATTLEQNLVDLGWHQKEFQLRSSFDYAVMSPDGSRLLGCVYVDPSSAEGVDAEVVWWVRASELESGLDEVLGGFLRTWIEGWPFTKVLWPGRTDPW